MEDDPANKNNLNDPFFYSDDPETVSRMAEAELANGKRERNRHLAEAAIANERAQEQASNNTNWGHTIEEDDPIHGFSEDPQIVQEAIKKLDEEQAARDQLAKQKAVAEKIIEAADDVETKPSEEASLEKEIEAEEDVSPDKREKELDDEGNPGEEIREQEERLGTLFKECKEYRERFKNPGKVRYRLLSVSAVEMERIEQSDDSEDRVKKNNEKIEEAVKKATGNDEADEYSGDTLAAVELYISEILVGNDADSVSVGVTETIVSPNGQIGKKPEKYKNLVAVRWIKNGINHVFAFSPRKDAAMYLLVDDSVGDSWKKKFFRAGAVDGEERQELSIMNHKYHDDQFHHEKSLEKVTRRVLEEEAKALRSNELSANSKSKIEASIAKQYSLLAHQTKQLPGITPDVEAENRDAMSREISKEEDA